MLSIDEVRRLLTLREDIDERARAGVLLALLAGLRLGMPGAAMGGWTRRAASSLFAKQSERTKRTRPRRSGGALARYRRRRFYSTSCAPWPASSIWGEGLVLYGTDQGEAVGRKGWLTGRGNAAEDED